MEPSPGSGMSGTFETLTPFGYGVFSPAGVIHWYGVPSLIHGVAPPWRWSVARFCVYDAQVVAVGSHGAPAAVSGPIPAPMSDVSTGMKRLPATPVGRKFVNLTRTGTAWATVPPLATMTGPRYSGGSTE